MTTTRHAGPSGDTARRPVAAVITICTHRKRIRPPVTSTAISLPSDSQAAVQSAWIGKIQTLQNEVSAGALYAGRGFGLAVEAARIAEANLYILSAGLGLVAAGQRVPVYGLTVSGGHAESVPGKITGEFDSAAWFAGLLSGPYSKRWADAAGPGSGRVLVALTRPYAEMVGKSLSELDPSVLARLRIFGASLAPALPEILLPALAPYDERLDAVLPGTRADFSQRALLHFVRTIVERQGEPDRSADFEAVEAALDDVMPPNRLHRPRRTDEEILHLILARLRSQSGIARVLRALRDEEGVACEQSRFSRLYRAALVQRTLA